MKKVISILIGLVCITLIVISPFLLPDKDKDTSQSSVILSVWHVDSFEGGKGSRYSFLRKNAEQFCKKYKGVFIVVSNFTPNSINQSLSLGKLPDVISYGNCFLSLENKAKSLSADVKDGGTIADKRYAVSYLRGGYFVIKRGDGGKEIVLSKGEYLTPEIACLFSSERSSNYLIKTPTEAYQYMLRNKNSTLIGTQRDIYRLINGNVEFSAQPIKEYSDVFQYLSLTSQKSQNEFYAKLFIDYMITPKVQQSVNSLGMLSVNQGETLSDNEYLSALESAYPNYTFSPFSDKTVFDNACDKAIALLKDGGETNEITNFLKQL